MDPLADALSPRVGLRLLRWFVSAAAAGLASAAEHHGADGHAGPTQQSVGLVLLATYAANFRALEISVSVAFSASLTRTPPMPRNPPSVAASATCWLI